MMIYASLAGAREGLSSSLIAFAVSMVIWASIVFSAVFWNLLIARRGGGGDNELVGGAARQAEEYLDVFRGLLILGFGPLLVAYVSVSAVNQLVRRTITRHCCRKRMSDAEYEHKGCVTLAERTHH